MTIKGTETLVYHTLAGFKRKGLYAANISIVGKRGVIETMRMNISEFFTIIVMWYIQ